MQKPQGVLHAADPPLAANPVAYEKDYFAWTQMQAEFLIGKRVDALDFVNLADEVGDLGRSLKREISSRLNILLLHLLKWKYQPERRSSSWKATIVEQRQRIVEDLEESPSLRSRPVVVLEREYRTARLKAAGETSFAEARFPEACPFTIDEILDPDFFPEAEEG